MYTAAQIDAKIKTLILRDALFVVNHSGGKDSQAMTVLVKSLVPANQIVVIHAELPGVDWAGTEDHARATSKGLEFISCKSIKTFVEMVRHRGEWPSPKYRQCTSDLKRGPIEKAIRHELKRRGHSGLVVSCMGIRAEESSARAKNNPFKLSVRNSKAGREWYDWLPIHDLLEGQVFQAIAEAGQTAHWAYGKGMRRLSCRFCIMASKTDLATAARLDPEGFSEFINLEKEIDRTMTMPVKGVRRWLEEAAGITLEQATQ